MNHIQLHNRCMQSWIRNNQTKRLFISLLLALSALIYVPDTCIAQIPKSIISKLDSRLKVQTLLQSVKDFQVQETKNGSITQSKKSTESSSYIILQSDQPDKTVQHIEALGGRVGSVIGTIITADIPSKNILLLAESADVLRIESSKPISFHSKKDKSTEYPTMVELNSAQGAQSGMNPDAKIYDGTGVIIGIIDSGIDYLHPDFAKIGDTLSSRILSLWDQNSNRGISPQGFNFGSEWKREKINQAIRNQDTSIIPSIDIEAHGTHVTGVAAGSGNLRNEYKGIAPNADIVVVSLDAVNSAKIIDAVRYIFQVAEREGKPAVINMSLGFQDERNDGTSLIDRALSYMVKEKQGRSLVAAAGNTGGTNNHWFVPKSTDDNTPRTNYLFASSFFSVPGLNRIIATTTMNIPLISIDSVWVGSSLDSITTILKVDGTVDSIHHKRSATTPIRSVRTLLSSQEGITDTLRYAPSGKIAGFIQWLTMYSDDMEAVYVQAVMVDTVDELPSWDKPFTSGYDMFGLMIASPTIDVNVFTPYGNTEHSMLPGVRRKTEDGVWNDENNVSCPASAQGVIAVGSYNHRQRYSNARGVIEDLGSPFTFGMRSFFSSAGIRKGSRIKPDISAPGAGVISALAWNRYEQSMQSDPLQVVNGGRHIIESGTSMASPAVAGAIALYLQKNPTSSQEEITHSIRSSARQDAFTTSNGELPNVYWGYGKLDVHSMLFGKVSSVEEQDAESLSLHPNPADNHLNVTLTSTPTEAVSIEISSLLGTSLIKTSSNSQSFRLDVSRLAVGSYILSIRSSDSIISRPIIITR
jgi:minor extracellular serine protease Vpr